MLLRKNPVSLLSLSAALAILTAGSVSAALLVYEPFNGYTAGDIAGQIPNANTVGLSLATAYVGGTAFDFTTSGLSFSNLVTSGGALRVTAISGTSAGTALSLSGAVSGTLYSSYLVNLTDNPSTVDDTVTMRINDSGAAAVATSRFRMDSQSGTGGVGNPDVIATGYDESMTDGSGSIVAGTTYLMLGRFTNVNSALSVGTPGTATVFALTAAQFDFFRADGSITDAELDAASIGSGAGEVTGKATESVTTGSESFATGNAIQFATQGGGGGITLRYDEARYGQSFNDVSPIPEPAVTGLLALGGLGLLRRRRLRSGA